MKKRAIFETVTNRECYKCGGTGIWHMNGLKIQCQTCQGKGRVVDVADFTELHLRVLMHQHGK